MAWARGEFGKNILDVSLHMDESSPHMHVLAVPLTKDGRLCAKEVLAKPELIRRQDGYAKAMEGFGLSRGDPAKETKRRHIKLTEEPGSGGKASALAAELAKAQAEISRLKGRLERLQTFNMDYSRKLSELERKLDERNTAMEGEAMRKQEEMDITLARLRDEFDVDTAAAEGLTGQELAEWLDQAEDAVFEREHAELRAQVAEKQALEAFWTEHHGLPRATPGQVKVGTLVASAGQFAVLHIGRGQHVLHEFPPGRVPEQELGRGQQRGIER